LEERSGKGVAMRIEVDWDLCESNAVCMGIAPDVFLLGDDDMLTVLQPEVTPENEDLVREAVRQCPRQAISIV
jgi:ferredoxin